MLLEERGHQRNLWVNLTVWFQRSQELGESRVGPDEKSAIGNLIHELTVDDHSIEQLSDVRLGHVVVRIVVGIEMDESFDHVEIRR